MRAPVTGAVLCAIAAVALLVAGFTPWFSTGKEIDPRRMRYEELRRDMDRFEIDDEAERVDESDVRANFGLVSGEVCIDLECKSAKYTGEKGLADDAFAWLGRGTVGAAMASVALLIAVALAARFQRRSILRGWAATIAATCAGLGAAFAASWPLEDVVGYVSRGMGLTAVIAGAAFAGVGVGWPTAPGNGAVAKRFGIAAVMAVLALLAWVTIVEHTWWKSVSAKPIESLELPSLHVSPLGVESCAAGECKIATALGVTAPLRALAVLTALASAVLLVPAFGAATRIARGVRPGAWGWSAGIVGVCALGAGVATWLVYPESDGMRMTWGFPVFAVAMLGTAVASFVGVSVIKAADAEMHAHAHVHAPLHHEPAFTHAIAPGERPQLAPLAAVAAGGGDAGGDDAAGGDAAGRAGGSATVGNASAVSKYAPSAAVAAAAVAAASGRTVVPSPSPSPNPDPSPSPSPSPSPNPNPNPSPAFDGGAAPVAVPVVVRPQPTAPTTPLRKASPMCPTCRVATIYSSKRGAWWCSTCKRTL